MTHLVLSEHAGAVSVITLNRPERSNSLVPDLLSELRSLLRAAGERPETRVVVLRAQGANFSTGGDVQGFWEHRDTLAGYAEEIVGLLNEVILTMMSHPKPIVVAVQGRVTGGSLGLVLAGDMVVVTPEASFQPWYSVVGFSPDGGWTALLPDVIGRQRAAHVLHTNELITGRQALEWGMAQELVPAAELLTVAMRIASVIADGQPGALSRSKRLLAGDLERLDTRLNAEREHFVHQIVTTEAREGMARFLGET